MSKACDEFCDCKIAEANMGKINDLQVAGVTDLNSYVIGKQDGERQAAGEGVRNYYRQQGVARAIAMIDDRLCFDFLKDKSTCEHQACWALFDLQSALIKGENK